jgi:SAM-dependent methyltransferase
MSAYPIESSERERARLARQAQLLRPITERLLRQAGAREGAAILDLGTGAGDVALLAAEIVGSRGRVLSLDRDTANLTHARERAAKVGHRHVTFLERDIGDPPADQPFDVAIGRYVLMYQDDPAATVRGVARAIKPGGAIAFHEINLYAGSRGDAWPEMPAEIRDALERLNAGMIRNVRAHIGVRLPSVFADAGLDISGWHFEGVAPVMNREDGVEQMRGVWAMWSRVAIAAGVVREDEIDFAMFDRWLAALPPNAALVQPTSVIGWATKPG